jgi:hypothetical protein
MGKRCQVVPHDKAIEILDALNGVTVPTKQQEAYLSHVERVYMPPNRKTAESNVTILETDYKSVMGVRHNV